MSSLPDFPFGFILACAVAFTSPAITWVPAVTSLTSTPEYFSCAYIAGYCASLPVNVFVVPYCILLLLYPLFAFLAAIPFEFILDSMSSIFKLLAVAPKLAFPYLLLHISFNKYTPLLYPVDPWKYTSFDPIPNNFVIFPFSSTSMIFHVVGSYVPSIVCALLYPLFAVLKSYPVFGVFGL